MNDTVDNPARPARPRVLSSLLRLSLWGMPVDEAKNQLQHWEGHLAMTRRESGPIAMTASAIWSFLSHLMWRLLLGPPSALMPGIALIFTGLGSGLLALLRPQEALQNLAVAFAALWLGTVLVRHPQVQPRQPLAIGTALCVPVLAAYSASIATDIWVPSDWFIVLGTAIIAVGMALVSLGASPLRFVELQVGRAWGFGLASVGAGAIAVAEIDWLRTWSGVPLLVAKLLAAIGTLAMAFTAWRIREIPQGDV